MASAASLDSDDNSHEDDDNANTIAPYDPSAQTPPNLPIYHEGLKLIETLAGKVLAVLKQFPRTAARSMYHCMEIEQLLEQLIKISKPPVEPMIQITITGDTGPEKSATLNSILGVDGLTPEVR